MLFSEWHADRTTAGFLFLLVVLGSVFRLIYGLGFQGWLGAPDQIAWGFLLDEARVGPIRYDQLVLWPHEGASPLISLAALLIGSTLGSLPSLSVAALGIDTVSRGIQVAVAWRGLGGRTAVAYALWTVAAVPALLPWATVNFGLHALSAFWPFVLLYAAARSDVDHPRPALLGLLTGLAISWSYDSLVLLPTCLIFVLVMSPRSSWAHSTLAFLGTTALGVLPHLGLRIFLDPGFVLGGDVTPSIRDVSFQVLNPLQVLSRLGMTLGLTLPGATLLPGPVGRESVWVIRWAWAALCYAGVLLALRNRSQSRVVVFGCLVLLSYCLLYSASPFFSPSLSQASFVYYRHIAYILPILALLGTHGWLGQAGSGRAMTGALLALGVLGGIHAAAVASPPAEIDYRGAGWILSRKMGHDPPRLTALLRNAPAEAQKDLAVGYGWGLAAVLLPEATGPDDSSFRQLIDLVKEFPDGVRPWVGEGVEHAFEPSVTPKLDPSLAPLVREALRR